VENKSTPGPWALAWEDGKYGVIGSQCEGKLVCIVGNNPDDGKNDIRKANATLIAAAPDLLVACEIAMQIIDPGEYPRSCKVISDAITKAKGGQSE
jgi:hypothetical protein